MTVNTNFPISFPLASASQPVPEIPYPDEGSVWDALWTPPQIDPTAWIAPGAIVVGRVRLKARSSVWYGCVLRGDGDVIEVGEETNVQDGSILHVDRGWPCVLGNRVTLGHRALVHASVVQDGAMIAIGATVLSRCVIGEQALIAAGAVVLEGTQVPPRTLWAGCPAKQIKELSDDQLARIAHAWKHYVNNGQLALARFGCGHIDELLTETTTPAFIVKANSFTSALAMISSLPLSDAEKAEAVRRLMAEQVARSK